jgi:hypothetical protein
VLAAIAGVSAYADDEPAGAILQTQSLIDHFKVRYWGNYSGPQLVAPGRRYTTDPWGGTKNWDQNADDLLTLGYQVTDNFRPGIGVPFNFVPMSSWIQIKPLYFGVVDYTARVGYFESHIDARFYTPIGDMASYWDVYTGFRTSQYSFYSIPKSNWAVGAYTYYRVWVYGPHGHGFRNDMEIYFSPFANYRFNSALSFTLWSDILQLGHQYGTPWGFSNLPCDVQPGIKWDISPSLNVNPYLNFIPSHLAWDAIDVGLVVNAAIL